MSDDGTYILRRDGKERFFYERWGGSYIDRVMLRGLDGFFEHLEKTREFPAPFLDLWLCGSRRARSDVFLRAISRQISHGDASITRVDL